MARARRRKQTAFQTDVTKSVFLYGEPNKEKLSLLIEAQARFLSLVNEYIQLLAKTEGFTLQLVKNDKKDSGIRKLEKQHRKPDVNSAASQNAFDMAVTRLSVRLDAIRIEMLSENATVFTRSKVLFAMSIEEKGQKEMEDAIAALSKKEGDFYDTCAAAIRDMDEAAFASAMREFHDSYGMCSIGYKIPELSSVEIPLDSRLMKILPSEGKSQGCMGLHAEDVTAKDGGDQRRGCRGHGCLVCLQRGTVLLHAAGPGSLQRHRGTGICGTVGSQEQEKEDQAFPPHAPGHPGRWETFSHQEDGPPGPYDTDYAGPLPQAAALP